MAKAAPVAERRYMGFVARRGCCICARLGFDVEGMPALVHHRIHGRCANMRASNYLTIPLCDRHHAVGFPASVHKLNAEQFLDFYGFTEMELITEVQTALLAYVPIHERVI